MRNCHKGDFLSARVRYISVGEIRPNPSQPRRHFAEDGLRELAESIGNYGILQPLTVRQMQQGYELVAGERRLRAARMVGLREVPCLVAQVDEEDSALLALIENLQRRDLDCWEEADAIARLIRDYGLSQEEAAARIGKSQSGVANKLRLLRLPEDVRALVRENGLTERHARALLRLTDEADQRRVIRAAVRGGWNVARTEEHVEKLLHDRQIQPPRRRSTYVIKDVRLFLNSVERGVQMMQHAGIGAVWGREDTDSAILLTIRIPKREEAR